jgi:hypothetical protein
LGGLGAEVVAEVVGGGGRGGLAGGAEEAVEVFQIPAVGVQ